MKSVTTSALSAVSATQARNARLRAAVDVDSLTLLLLAQHAAHTRIVYNCADTTYNVCI